jgi:hypothetical protein
LWGEEVSHDPEHQEAVLWRGHIENRPGALAEVLEPIAAAKSDLEIVMGYREPSQPEKAVIELFPVRGRKLTQAVEEAGLKPSAIPALVVSGTNRTGLAHKVACAIADAGINLAFLVAQTVGRNYSAIFGFESAADAARAASLIRKATR